MDRRTFLAIGTTVLVSTPIAALSIDGYLDREGIETVDGKENIEIADSNKRDEIDFKGRQRKFEEALESIANQDVNYKTPIYGNDYSVYVSNIPDSRRFTITLNVNEDHRPEGRTVYDFKVNAEYLKGNNSYPDPQLFVYVYKKSITNTRRTRDIIGDFMNRDFARSDDIDKVENWLTQEAIERRVDKYMKHKRTREDVHRDMIIQAVIDAAYVHVNGQKDSL